MATRTRWSACSYTAHRLVGRAGATQFLALAQHAAALESVATPEPGAGFDGAAASRLLGDIWGAFTEERSAVAARTPPATAVAAEARQTVLIADDDEDQHFLMSRLLHRAGFKVGRGDEGPGGHGPGAGDQAGGHPPRRADAGSGRLHHGPPAQGAPRHRRHPVDVPDRPEHGRRSPRRAAHRRRRLRLEVGRSARAGVAGAEAVRSRGRAARRRRDRAGCALGRGDRTRAGCRRTGGVEAAGSPVADARGVPRAHPRPGRAHLGRAGARPGAERVGGGGAVARRAAPAPRPGRRDGARRVDAVPARRRPRRVWRRA